MTTPAMPPAAALQDRGPSDAPVRRLTVLFDPGCMLCRFIRGWLERQRQLVPLDFVPAGSAQAVARFPALDHSRTLREITVIGDGGQVYEAAAAWVVLLWALRAYRPTSHRFSTPAGAPLARGMVLSAAKWRRMTTPGAPPRATPFPVGPTAQGRAGPTGTTECGGHCSVGS
ncbi:thiol-disulfide oxidoreductase DCC family protein [Streptacidiphilus sp. EB129]|uniref:thiol-disulfide oxidoreductase DCC family protein n=1 Tax=Streptacidiphilus sp. EB129 TaxID=3156262 RepID=UPI003514F129